MAPSRKLGGEIRLYQQYTAHIQQDYFDWSLSKNELIHLNSLAGNKWINPYFDS